MDKIRNIWPYALSVAIVTAMLCVMYRYADLNYPLTFAGGDEAGAFTMIKTIRDYGIQMVNPMLGGQAGEDFYDYYLSDGISFLLIRLISLFVTNVYLIANIYYFICHLLIACSSVYVCQKAGYSGGIAVPVSVLYALSAYIQMRYAHMWLVPYFMLPFACLTALKIAEGELLKENAPFWKNKSFYQALAVSFFCAFTGLYYAFFTCVLYAVGMVIRLVNLKKDEIKRELYPVFMIFSVIAGCMLSLLPNMLYAMEHGSNPESEMVRRSMGDSEFYGLKLVQLLLPRINHRISCLRELAGKYCENYPLVNENSSASIGIIATAGFVISVIWLFQNNKKRKYYSYFNIGIFLVATIGGIGSIFSLLVETPMRCYNRMSLVIMFYSLLCVAELLSGYEKKLGQNRKNIAFGVILMLVTCIGLYDQTRGYVPYDYSQLDRNREFVKRVEAQMDGEGMIFQLPYVDWPSAGHYRMFAGYLESENLRWSYGAMQGREEARWQQAVCQKEVPVMIEMVIRSGYSGIYLDKTVYTALYGETKFQQLYDSIVKTLQLLPVVSEKEDLFFWDIRDYASYVDSSQTEAEKKEVSDLSYLILAYDSGFYGLETDGEHEWRWCQKEGCITVENIAKHSVTAPFTMHVATLEKEYEQLEVRFGGQKKMFRVNEKGTDISLILELPTGISKIQLQYQGRPGDYPDPRELAFQVQSAAFTDSVIRTQDVIYADGFYDEESDGARSWHWCSGQGNIRIYNPCDTDKKIRITCNAWTGYGRTSHLTVSYGNKQTKLPVSSQASEIEFECNLKPGKNVIRFQSDEKRYRAKGDSRKLVFAIQNLVVY